MPANGRWDIIRRLKVKYIKSVLWRVAKRLSYIEEARCLKVKALNRPRIKLVFVEKRVEFEKTDVCNVGYRHQIAEYGISRCT